MTDATSNMQRPHIVMTIFGRCGSFFLHSLFDGHSQLSSIPGVAPTFILSEAISSPACRNASTADLALFMAQRLDRYFHGEKYREGAGLDHLGENGNETLTIDINVFHRHLLAALQSREHLPLFARLDEAMHDAFDLTVSGTHRPRIFFHVHALSHAFAKEIVQAVPDHRLVFLLREPVDNIESCVNFVRLGSKKSQAKRLPWFYGIVRDMLTCQADSAGILGEDTIAVRLEDVKAAPESTLRTLCAALDLPFEPALLRSTFMGKAYGTVPTLRNPDMRGFANPASAPQGYRLTPRDRAFFGTLFRNTSLRTGYPVSDAPDAETMRAIVSGSLLDTEIELARCDGISVENLLQEKDAIEFRRFLAQVPGILTGPACGFHSRVIVPNGKST